MAKDLFGTLAVRKGLATESEVDVALEAQRDQEGEAPRIGEILVEMGTLTPDGVKTVLKEQDGRALQPTAPRLVLRSGPPVRLNGSVLEGIGTAGPGDRVEIGGAQLAVEGAAIEIVAETAPVSAPAPSALATATTTQMPTATPVTAVTAAAPVEAAKTEPVKIETPAGSEAPKMSVFTRIDAVLAKVLPSVHNHRKYLTLVLAPGLLSLFLPWRVAAESRQVFGIQGPGWLVFLLLAFAAFFTAAGPRAKSLRKSEKVTVLAATGLALALSLFQLFVPPDWAKGIGIGLPLAMLSAIGSVLVGAFCKAEAGPIAETAFGLAGRALRDMSGKRGKEKLAALERRDELLRQLGEAALETGKAPGPDADAAAKAKMGLEETKKMITGPQAKAAVKTAEGKLRRALQKLGRAVADENLPLDGRQLPTAEILALDEKIRELG